MEINTYKSLFYTFQNKDSKFIILCIHGLGESSFSFQEAFNYLSINNTGIITFDLPGFGSSSYTNTNKPYIQSSVDIIQNFILGNLKTEQIDNLILLSHSAGNIIGLELHHNLQLKLPIITIDGIYKTEKWRYSTHVLNHSSPENFKQAVISKCIPANYVEEKIRYISSLARSDENALYHFAKEIKEMLYQPFSTLLSLNQIAVLTEIIEQDVLNYLNSKKIRFKLYNKSNHWPQITDTKDFYIFITRIIQNIIKKQS